MDKIIHNRDITICNESPMGCSFLTEDCPQGTEYSSLELEQHVLLFCSKGHIRITSNLFAEEYLCAGEILFIPRGSDYHGVALSGLSFLYTYKRIGPSRKELNTTIGMHRFSSMNPVG